MLLAIQLIVHNGREEEVGRLGEERDQLMMHVNVGVEILAWRLLTCHPWDGVSTAVLGLCTVVAWGWNLSAATRGKRDMLKIDYFLHETFMKSGNFYF